MTKQKKILTVCLIILFLSFTVESKRNHVITEGESIDDIKLGMKVDQVESILKSKPIKITWKEYSYEYKYKNKGISIYVKQDDPKEEIFAITINPKRWKGKTEKGLNINRKLRIKNVIEIYGKPEWSYNKDGIETEAEYEKIGIYFSVDTTNRICNDSLPQSKKIIDLTIGKIGTDY
jgi:hypothetical protein